MVAVGRALGSNYELRSLLGSGAMGDVWVAIDRSTGAEVAAKVLKSEYSQNPDIIARFIQERSILLGLEHPNIVRVRDLVVERDSLAIVMDLVDGTDLRGALRQEGTLAPTTAVRVAAYVLEGLAAAHSQGALHRDVKPDNVLLVRDWRELGPDAVRLSDFSIARLAQESTVQATGLLGTPEYMPPELFESGTSSAASDVYAAGVLLYQLLAGRTPFAGPGTAFTIGNRAVTMEAPALDLPGPLWQLLSSLLSKDPRRRPKASTAAQTLRELAPALVDVPPLPAQPTPDSWRRSGGAGLVREPIRPVDAPAAFDVGGTNLDVSFAAEEPRAEREGGVRALVPGPAAALDAGVTNVGGLPREYVAPELTPSVDAPTADGRRRLRTPMYVGGALVLVAAIVIAVVLLRGGGHGGVDPAATAGAASRSSRVDALRQDQTVPGTGLELAREATYDTKSRSVEMTVHLKADRVALQGPVLQVIPLPQGGEQCPLVAWDGASVTKDSALVSGITAPCAYRLDVPQIPAGQTVSVKATLPLTLKGDPEKALGDWLDQVANATSQALQQTGPNNTAYAIQRLESVEVKAPDFATTRTGQLRVVLYPRWVGSGVDTQHVLYDSTEGDTTDLLDEVAGGLAGVRLTDGCNGAVSIRKGLFVSVLHQSDSCEIDATVGNLTDLRSNTFQIAGLGG
ncbi:serine/threonine-protein kinase [Oryzihumus leptocrescens]|uniref:non-specific serine/threonine protein kinase n=1 Tax=Oryzihumus leptocrescens TaxID=297536 RepID=A0A542ZGX5_9MICO|nr:serine/threonine-protein kinase [Oryzihumus leptocrescens]TQL59574.1 serine/threonine-protein kinase [Oryzihumus leptocrescens]